MAPGIPILSRAKLNATAYRRPSSIVAAGRIGRPGNVLQYLPLHARQLGNIYGDASSRQPPQSSAFVSVIGEGDLNRSTQHFILEGKDQL